MSVLLVSSDLLFGSQVAGAAARTGVDVKSVSTFGDALARCTAESPNLLILDLSIPGLNVSRFVSDVRSVQSAAKIVAFGPHVQTSRLQEAEEAGCDQVLSRGALHGRIDEILGRSQHIQP